MNPADVTTSSIWCDDCCRFVAKEHRPHKSAAAPCWHSLKEEMEEALFKDEEFADD